MLLHGLPPLAPPPHGGASLRPLPRIPALPAAANDTLHLGGVPPQVPSPSLWLRAREEAGSLYQGGLQVWSALGAYSNDIAQYSAYQALRRLPRIAGGLPAEVPVFLSPLAVARQSSGFGWRVHPIHHRRSFHSGIDLAAPQGTVIRAAASGQVRLLPEKSSGGYGNLVILDHGDGYSTRYGHASRFLVRSGARVLAGQPIALVGSTGNSTGPHLHFEVRYRGTAQAPGQFLT